MVMQNSETVVYEYAPYNLNEEQYQNPDCNYHPTIWVASDREIEQHLLIHKLISVTYRREWFRMHTSIETIKREIDIACQAIIEAGFSGTLSKDTFLCDIYHRPAHNNQNTIFARLFVSAGRLFAIYAKAIVFQLGLKITTESFETTKAANLHGGTDGHIVCGVRYLDGFHVEDIRQALREAAGLSVLDKQGFSLDDESYFVSSAEGQSKYMRSCGELSFLDVESIHLLTQMIDAIDSKAQ